MIPPLTNLKSLYVRLDDYWLSLVRYMLSGGDRRKNLYVHVKNVPAVEKGLAFLASLFLISILWLVAYSFVFGLLPPSGISKTVFGYVVIDHQLDMISRLTVPIFGLSTLSFLWLLCSANKRYKTLPYMIKIGNRALPKKSRWKI